MHNEKRRMQTFTDSIDSGKILAKRYLYQFKIFSSRYLFLKDTRDKSHPSYFSIKSKYHKYNFSFPGLSSLKIYVNTKYTLKLKISTNTKKYSN